MYYIQSPLCMQVREMEAKLKQYGISEMTTNPQDYISRKDHARICDARVSAREADLQVTVLPLVCLSVNQSVCLSVCLGSRPAGHCSAPCLSVSLSVCLAGQEADLPRPLSARQFIFWFVYLPGMQTCRSLSCPLSVCLSVCQSVWSVALFFCTSEDRSSCCLSICLCV